MSLANFPLKREDGSLSVACRFSAPPGALARVEGWVEGWTRGIMATRLVDLLEDLSAPPRVVARKDGYIDIVFDGKPASRRWKDWMVYLSRDLGASSIPGVNFEGFYDLVADAPHPASVRRPLPDNT